jgi:hypothetical protein
VLADAAQSAPSVAIFTGAALRGDHRGRPWEPAAGSTRSWVMPRPSRCANQAASSGKHSSGWATSWSITGPAKDYLILNPPFTTVIQAAANKNVAADTFVAHKGFNSMTVGNHKDGATAMSPTSLFGNPDSFNDDRELPDLAANGTTVSATGLTKSGTSFAAPAVAGTAAVLQSVDRTLAVWPEGCRAILLTSAGRNISDNSWNQDANSRRSPPPSGPVDGVDGSGALDTAEAARIARARRRRKQPPARRGWDVGRLDDRDFQSNGNSRFRYHVTIPSSGPRRLKAALAWTSKITYTEDTTLSPPVKVTESKLTVDLDLYVLDGSVLAAQSSTFDNSFEIVEFDGERGKTYDISIKRASGTDWVFFGIAWTLF